MINAKSMRKEFSFFELYDRFIEANIKGKRLQPNGKRISAGTITNYKYTRKVLKDFSELKRFELRIRPIRKLNKRELNVEKNYWKKFYKRFTDYLYFDRGHFDNYVGQTIKNIKLFFNYLNKELVSEVGEFHKLFYVRKEDIAIFPLMPEELNFLINDHEFENELTKRMKEVKDFFVFGCTVSLRVSDLLDLKKSNCRVINNQHYLSVRSLKTSTDTLIKLPGYAVEIILKYKKYRSLLPPFNKSNLNKYIKKLLELAGFTHSVRITRQKRGRIMEDRRLLRFCDVASTHTMRRTAITTMLSLGMPEQVVRRISGHSPGSKEFYRYVLWSQTYQDQETEKMFEKLETKLLTLPPRARSLEKISF